MFSTETVFCQTSCSTGPCYPPPEDISGKFNLTANSTCGELSPESYCFNLQCDKVCDANNESLKHPASNVQDSSFDSFWKSKNFEYPVSLQLDIGRNMLLYRSVVSFYHELPSAMYFLKSNDSGESYSPLIFFATNCTEYFNMRETGENEIDALEVQCFKIDTAVNVDKQLSYIPLRDESVSEDLLSDKRLQEFFLITNLKLVLVKFVTASPFNPDEISDSLKRGFYFSVKDWDVQASCFCNGQASKCDDNDVSKCICERNTDGHNCERCLPLFNNKTYRFREACEACQCYNHADHCTYNETKGYGVCDNCTDNTYGDRCEFCKQSFYRNPAVSMDDANTCLSCACHVPGVNSSADSLTCDGVTGQCACKINVTGRACDTCKDTYWNLRANNEAGCEDCRCNVTGTINGSDVCDKVNGQCPCKPLLTGRTCNKCQDGFFGLTAQNPGCTACNCDMAGSVNKSCSSTGQCYCRPRFSGDKCDEIESGFFVPSVDFMTFEAEDAMAVIPPEKRINHMTIVNAAGDNILVVGVDLKEGTNNATPTVLQFTVDLPKTGFYNLILRYKTNYEWALIRINTLLRTPAFVPFSCNNETQVDSNEPYILSSPVAAENEAHDFGKQCFLAGQYRVNLEIPFQNAQPAVISARRRRAEPDPYIFVDSIVAMPTVPEYYAFKEASPAVQDNMTYYYNASASLRTWSANSKAGSSVLSGIFGEIFGEGQSCNCSTVGSNNPQQCERNGGQCSCKMNVIGRTCEACRPDYFNFTSGQGCIACNCSDIGANETSCHPETGQCSCRENVIGQQCDSCRQHFYNFNSREGCSACNCHLNYSRSLQCNGSSGVCDCMPGVNGDKCTGCADQFYNLTYQGCSPCDCNSAGSMNLVCDKATGYCPCKVNSLGMKCNTCPSGFYGLEANHPEGCLKCQCSNKTSNCTDDLGWFISHVFTDLSIFFDNVDVDGWTGVNSAGGSVAVALNWDFPVEPLAKASMEVDTRGSEDVYFVAPAKYLGDKRLAYTLTMSFQLRQGNASFPAASSKGDVILEGRWFDQPLVTILSRPPPDASFYKYEVKFVESAWRVGNTSGRHPTSNEMIRVLSHLTSLRIRAKWTIITTSQPSFLGDIVLMVSNRTSVIQNPENVSNVERCSCPPEYKGQFCEQCADGYTRSIPNGGPYMTCVPCQCNNHTNTCHPETGVCFDCSHNTTGDHCETCSDGWYGNATHGTPEDCSPCPCPGGPYASNQFASTCFLDSDGLPTCVGCSLGYENRFCNVCSDGYFGRPWEPYGQCRKCECNNNTDPSIRRNCDITTGECFDCLHNTTGFNCEWCAPEFHGSALNKTCTPCNCSSVGAVSNVCNNVTGYCNCRQYVTGKSCDSCEENAFNFTRSGCMPCNCDSDGSTDLQCDLMSGNCSCKEKVIGSKCDMCSAGFFDVTQGCLDCNCTSNQTVTNTTCDPMSGQCQCSISPAGGDYGGRQCDACARYTVAISDSPLSCYACTEPCYRNWEGFIAIETEKVNQLSGNVTELLESFSSGMSVDGINRTLQRLNTNLTYVNQIFNSGGRADLKQKREQINRIQDSILTLQTELNKSQSSIEDAQRYLADNVTNFNGSVRIIPAMPLMYFTFPVVCPSEGGVSVVVDWRCIEAMAATYRRNALLVNESGYANYTSIENSYHEIQQSNLTAYRAAEMIDISLSKLPEISELRNRTVETVDNFTSLFRNNSLKLQELELIATNLLDLLSLVENLNEEAAMNLFEANETVTQARNQAGQKNRDAQKALDDAEGAFNDVMEVNRTAKDIMGRTEVFKENASRVLDNTKEAINNVTEGINKLAGVRNMTLEAVEISNEVRAMSIPVSLQEIKNLTNDILNTNVSQEMVNRTLESAHAGLTQAREVEKLSQRAITAVQETLSVVQSIEDALNSSESIRQEVMSLHQETDQMIANISNITQTVNEKFSASYISGRELLAEMNATYADMEDGLQCFDKAQYDAQNASDTAQLAFNIAENASQTFGNSSASLRNIEERVNSSFDIATANLTEIEDTFRESEELLKDVTEAQELLQQYMDQRTELERLGQEIRELDEETDILLEQFAIAAEQYGQCAGAS